MYNVYFYRINVPAGYLHHFIVRMKFTPKGFFYSGLGNNVN